MHRSIAASAEVVSAKVYGLILGSPRLRQQLLPEGFSTSPYKVLNYDATLTIEDPSGSVATFQRRQKIQFQHDGVQSILDHYWGDGIMVTDYSNSAGVVTESLRDGGYRHLVIQLKRAGQRGEVLDFIVERKVMEAFGGDDEWVETIVDHPVDQLKRSVVFPKERPCLTASLECEGLVIPVPVQHQPDGRTTIRVSIPRPQAHTSYVLRWSW